MDITDVLNSPAADDIAVRYIPPALLEDAEVSAFIEESIGLDWIADTTPAELLPQWVKARAGQASQRNKGERNENL